MSKIYILTIFSMTSALVQKLACPSFRASAFVLEKIVKVARTDEQINLSHKNLIVVFICVTIQQTISKLAIRRNYVG